MGTSIFYRLAAGLAIWLSLGAGVRAAELVMVEEPGCPWCARWNAEIGPIYPKTPEARIAPLRRIDISVREPEGFTYAKRVVFTPTFVLIHEGREVGRIEGYAGDEFFWVLLQKMMEDNDLMLGDG